MTTDILCETANEIEKAASGLGLIVFHTENLESIWDEETGEDAEGRPVLQPANNVLEWEHSKGGHIQFLKTAKQLSLPMVYMRTKVFSWRTDLYEPLLQDTGCTEEERAKMTEYIAQFRQYDGYVEYIIIAFKMNNVWHTYEECADWYKNYSNIAMFNPEN